MRGQLESFLHAIREAPEDDVPRLVLADWFEDNGDPQRAEFIRTQIRLDGDLSSEERRALESREKELLAANAARWLGPLAAKPWDTTFHRGTARPKIQTGRLLSSAKVLKQAQEHFTPALVTELHAEGTTSRWKGLFKLSLLEDLTGLVLGGCKMSEADVQTLAASPRLHNLRHLAVCGAASPYRGLERIGMTALIESPHLRRLTGLNFCNYPLNHAAVELLTKQTPWPALTSLNLDTTPLHDYTLGLLLKAPWKPQLTDLSVFRSVIHDEAVQWLVRDLAPARPRRLGLGGNRVADGGAAVIAASEHLSELRDLFLNFPSSPRRERDRWPTRRT